MLKVPYLFWRCSDDVNVDHLRTRYTALRVAQEMDPSRLTEHSVTVLESHEHVAETLGYDDPEDLYNRTDLYGRAGLAILRTYVPTWFR